MSRTNIAKQRPKYFTPAGAPTVRSEPVQALRKLLTTCMLWEDQFYRTGNETVKDIDVLVSKINPSEVVSLISEARNVMKIRHAPLYAAVALAKRTLNEKSVVLSWAIQDAIDAAIQRPDEIAEFLSLYWLAGKCPIANSVKRGLAAQFHKFDEYQFAKWRGSRNGITLRDVMFLVHPQPKNRLERELFRKIADNKLRSHFTWEAEISASDGKNKATIWRKLIKDGKLGGMAVLMNLRNMLEAGLSKKELSELLELTNFSKVLPFRFLSALTCVPELRDDIEAAFLRNAKRVSLPGMTYIIVDCSGSMDCRLSRKGYGTRTSVARMLAVIGKTVCQESRVFATAGNDYERQHKTMELHNSGFALLDEFGKVRGTIYWGGIFTAQVVDYVAELSQKLPDRVVIVTDEADCDLERKPSSAKPIGRHNYIMNVGAYETGFGQANNWTEISGFSDRLWDYISVAEN